MSLKQKAISGVKWTTLSTVILALTQLLQISILARYLDKDAFGLLALVMLVIGFSQIFVDMGVSSAIIHKQSVTHEQLSTLYWLNILSAIFVYGIVVLLSPFIASFYEVPQLHSLIILTSVTIIIQAFGKQFFVLFEKELQFNILAKIDIFSALSGFALAVYLAMHGYGVYALIYPLIATASIKAILLILFGLKYHQPKLYFNFSEVKEFVIFGMYQMGTGIVGYFNSQFDIIIIGKVLGSETLGLYSIIKQLVMRPAQIINPVVTRVTFPTMAKIQNDTQRLKEIYLKTIYYLSSVNFPIYILMMILAPEIISIFLGQKWLGGVVLFQILSIFALIRSTGNPIGSLLLAKGKVKLGMYWNMGLFALIPISIYLGSLYGIEGVAWSWVILQVVLKVPGWRFLVYRLCGASLKEYMWVMIKPLMIASIAGMVTYFVLDFFDVNSLFLNMVLGSFVMALGFGAGFIWADRHLIALIRKKIGIIDA